MESIDRAPSSSAVRESDQSHSSEQGNAGVEVANSPDLTIEHAKYFLNRVKERLKDESENYEMLLVTLRDFFLKRSGIAFVKQTVIEALKGHLDLIVAFNTFLPKGHLITLDELQIYDPRFELLQMVAHSFFEEIQARCRDLQIYKSFMQFLMNLHTKRKIEPRMIREVAAIFEGHRDLYLEFTRFLIFFTIFTEAEIYQ